MEYADIIFKALTAILGIALGVIGYFFKGAMTELKEMQAQLNSGKIVVAEVVRDIVTLRSKIDDTSHNLVRVETKAEKGMEAIHQKQDRQDDRLLDIQKSLSGIMATLGHFRDIPRDVSVIREKLAKIEGHGE